MVRRALLLVLLACLTVATVADAAEVRYDTPGLHEFVVPAYVYELDVVLVGGRGGRPNSSVAVGTPGGNGARVAATVPVTPGESLWAAVGANGDEQALPGATGTTGRFAGFGGGGDGGRGETSGFSSGGAGGGATDLRSAPTDLASRRLVAGGGGGAGNQDGSAGGDAGVAGSFSGGREGAPGTVAAGGAGGVSSGGVAGQAGALGLGGTAGGGSAGSPTGNGGGGGGGGFYGGGGGAGGPNAGSSPTGGGGGGSSYAPDGVLSLDTSGTPVAVLRWEPDVPVVADSTDVAFGARGVGDREARTVTLANPGTGPLTLGTNAVGVAGTAFSVVNGCPEVLEAGARCPVAVTFAPNAAGAAAGQLTVAPTGSRVRTSVVLTGEGVAPAPQSADPAGQAPPPSATRPAVQRLRLTATRFRVGTRPRGGARRVVSGTTVRFRLATAARVRLTVQRLRGRRARTVGTIRTRPLPAGERRVRFAGRLARRALPPGRYRLVVVATDDAGARSAPARAAFRVVR